MKKQPDSKPVLPQPTLQRSPRPLSPSSDALSGVRGPIWKSTGDLVQITVESGDFMRMPTVSYQIDGETIATSTTMVESRWFGVLAGREAAVQRISSPMDALSLAEGRLFVIGYRISLIAVLGVFVPLYLSVLIEVVMGVCLDCSWTIVRSLYLGGFAYRVKDPNHSGSHLHNPLISICYRVVMLDLSPYSPLSGFSSSIEHRNVTQVFFSTGPCNPQPPFLTFQDSLTLAVVPTMKPLESKPTDPPPPHCKCAVSVLLHCFDFVFECLVPFCLIGMAISEFLLVVVEDCWPLYMLGIYSECAHDGLKLYCNETGEFWLVLLRKGLVGLCFALCQSKLCTVMMFNGNFLMMIISCYGIEDHIAIFVISSVGFWPGWYFLGSETKGSCVLGWAVQLSVAPCKGEQPWTRAPRCYFLWSMWSVLIYIFTEIQLQSIKSVDLCSFVDSIKVRIFLQLGPDVFFKPVLNEACYFGFVYFNKSAHGLMLDKLASILFCMLYWDGTSCCLFLLPTFTERAGFPTGQSCLGLVLWWLFIIVPAASFAVQSRLWAQLNLCGWLNCRMCIWLLIFTPRCLWCNAMSWSITSDCYLWIAKDEHALDSFPVFYGHVNGKAPGFGTRIGVAPSFGEQPVRGIPRCCCSWSLGSMMHPLSTVTSYLSLLRLFWCLPFKALAGTPVFIMNMISINNNCEIKGQREQTWLLKLHKLFGNYPMALIYRIYSIYDITFRVNYLWFTCDSFWHYTYLLSECAAKILRGYVPRNSAIPVMEIHFHGEQHNNHFHWSICGYGPNEYNLQFNTPIMYFRIRTICNGYFRCILPFCTLSPKDHFITNRAYSMVSEVVRHVKPYTTSKAFY